MSVDDNVSECFKYFVSLDEKKYCWHVIIKVLKKSAGR